jgi:hypothetical protein
MLQLLGYEFIANLPPITTVECIPLDMAEGTEETHPLEHGKTLRAEAPASILMLPS